MVMVRVLACWGVVTLQEPLGSRGEVWWLHCRTLVTSSHSKMRLLESKPDDCGISVTPAAGFSLSLLVCHACASTAKTRYISDALPPRICSNTWSCRDTWVCPFCSITIVPGSMRASKNQKSHQKNQKSIILTLHGTLSAVVDSITSDRSFKRLLSTRRHTHSHCPPRKCHRRSDPRSSSSLGIHC
jgi:hypothetical protein